MPAPIIGDSNDNILRGAAEDDEIRGEGGDDILRGRAGDDLLYGGGGDDDIRGGAGDDEIYGGAGDDEIRGGAGDDVISADSGDDVVNGGAGDDEIDGGSGDDELSGGAGDDVIAGGSGDDAIRGGSGDDVLYGGSGDDEIRGGAGDDVIDGGAGDDELSGGAGDDVFRFTGAFGDDVITDFDKSSDRIDLTAFTSYELTQVGDDTLVSVAGGQILLKNVTPEGLADAIDVACLMRGTLVRTPRGDRPVEELQIGDEVITIDGVARPLKWIGRRSYSASFVKHGSRIAPVVISAGALGENTPRRDLYVSPEHAVYVDGALVAAKLLVNGGSVWQDRDIGAVDYYHLELETPDVLWTNDAPTESYVNHGNRRMFGNWSDYVALYGGEDEAPRGADGLHLRRFRMIYGGAALQAIRSRLARAPAADAA